MRKSHEIKEDLAEFRNEAESIVATAEKEKRGLSKDEDKRFEFVVNKRIPVLENELQATEQEENSRLQRAASQILKMNPNGFKSDISVPQGGRQPQGVSRSKWVDAATGNQVPVYGKGDPLPHSDNGLCLGRYIKAMICGDPRMAPDEFAAIRNQLGGQSVSGSELVPDFLSNRIIDLMRAKSVVFQSGAQMVEMPSDNLSIARIDTPVSIETKAENVAFSGSEATYSRVVLNTHTVGQVSTVSRELAQDAVNFSEAFVNNLAADLAAEIDRLVLVGAGTTEILGVLNIVGIGTTAVTGPITWEAVHGAATGIRGKNYEPNGYVVSPTNRGALELTTSGDGVNAAKLWLGPPSGVAELSMWDSSNMTDTDAIVGDWSSLLVGMRTGLMIETSNEAGEAFEKHQTKIKATWRIDSTIERNDAFWSLTGLT